MNRYVVGLAATGLAAATYVLYPNISSTKQQQALKTYEVSEKTFKPNDHMATNAYVNKHMWTRDYTAMKPK